MKTDTTFKEKPLTLLNELFCEKIMNYSLSVFFANILTDLVNITALSAANSKKAD